MNTMSDFYDNLDLKYPEIGIAIQKIDRSNPGLVKFIVPIMTPSLDITKEISTTKRIDRRNVMNSARSFPLNNITISNYIELNIPKELCFRADCFKVVDGYIVIDEELRYIPEGSKWIIAFVGGDITKPQVIGLYTENKTD